ncbi:MAG: NAD(P)/FAD-dependent oxidoreductase [Opitutaceae bacterium]|nr:NAD(P)/FAD-dependent oxidoreductase [Opitutaceae bacterium]
MNSSSHYDVVIIGAGMSGLAAGIRLAHFGRRVCIFERHNTVGGLNSFYSINGRKFDVGLHAMTNYVRPGVKGTPLGKLLRQLRINREEFALCEQKQSRIAFGPHGETALRFTNDFAVLEADVAAKFPRQIDGFRQLLQVVRTCDDVSLDTQPVSAREVIRRHLTDPLLEDMLCCPLMYYGSARERDMEFSQFVIMFKALFLEGFARPLEGVRVILRVLMDKYRQAGGERRMKCGVQRILAREGRAAALVLDSGEEITADHVISSIGAPETTALCMAESRIADLPAQVSAGAPPSGISDFGPEVAAGRLSFVETIAILSRQPAELGWGSDTIVFFNDSPHFEYARPEAPVDPRSGVICIPNNFNYAPGAQLSEGIWRVTCLANYDRWAGLPEEVYRAEKQRWFAEVQRSARRFLPGVENATLAAATVTTDMFTPRTITKFTGHFNGAIYGAPNKSRQGRTALRNLYLCGTDQGFLGIVGAMLSGISMANYHILQKGP